MRPVKIKRPGSSPGLFLCAARETLRQCRQHIRRRVGRSHLHPHLGDLALGIDQERVAVGHHHAGQTRPATRTRSPPCGRGPRADGRSAHPWCRTACGCRRYPRSRPESPHSWPRTGGSASWNLCASMVQPGGHVLGVEVEHHPLAAVLIERDGRAVLRGQGKGGRVLAHGGHGVIGRAGREKGNCGHNGDSRHDERQEKKLFTRNLLG